MQLSEVYHDVDNNIVRLQLAVNNLIASNIRSGMLNGTNLISSADMLALNNAMTTLQVDRVTLKNIITPIVAGN